MKKEKHNVTKKKFLAMFFVQQVKREDQALELLRIYQAGKLRPTVLIFFSEYYISHLFRAILKKN